MIAAYLTPVWWVVIFLSVGMFMSVVTRKLTVAGALAGGIMGLAIFLGTGFTGLALLSLFFVLGTGATAWKLKYKQNLGLAETNKCRRTAGQAFANAGVAAILSLTAWAYPEYAGLFSFMVAAGFASATADTLSSELGNVYGSEFYHILTGQKSVRGLNGVISREGTAMGIIGSIGISFVYGVGFGWSGQVAGLILAGTIGNLTDSVLGATLEQRGYLSNNAVNFLNTLVGALVGGSIYVLS